MQLSRLAFNSSDIRSPLLVAAGETAVAALWLPLIGGVTGASMSAPSAAGLFIIGLFAYGWTQGNQGHRPITLTTAVALLLIVAWLLATTGGHDATRGWPVIVLGAAAWGHGSFLAGKGDLATPERAHRLLGVGALLSGTALFVSFAWHSPASEAVQRAAWWTIPILLLSALLLAALGVAGAITPRDGSPATRQEASAGGFVAALLLVAVALIVLFGGGTDLPQHALFFVIKTAFNIIYWLLVGMMYAFLWVVGAILRLLHIHLDLSNPQQPPTPPPPPQRHAQLHQATPLWVDLALIVLVTLLVLVLLRWYLPRLRGRWQRRRSRSGVAVVRSSLNESDSFFGNLRDLWPRRPSRRQRATIDLHAPPADVRDAYRKLLVIATRSGQPRVPSESPRDYAVRLAGVWSDLGAPIVDLTERYVAVRYGEISSIDDLNHARVAWERIRAVLLEANTVEPHD
jgi:hypothetical protein